MRMRPANRSCSTATRSAKASPISTFGKRPIRGHRWFVAYAVDDKGSEFFTLRVRDIASGRDLDEFIPDTWRLRLVGGGFEEAVYWVARDENARPVAVYRHELGAVGEKLVYRGTRPRHVPGRQRHESHRKPSSSSALRQPGDQQGLADPCRRSDRRAAPCVGSPDRGALRTRKLDRPLRGSHKRRCRHRLQEDVGRGSDPSRRKTWRRMDAAPARRIRDLGLHAGQSSRTGWRCGERADANDRFVFVRREDLYSHTFGVDEEAYALAPLIRLWLGIRHRRCVRVPFLADHAPAVVRL